MSLKNVSIHSENNYKQISTFILTVQINEEKDCYVRKTHNNNVYVTKLVFLKVAGKDIPVICEGKVGLQDISSRDSAKTQLSEWEVSLVNYISIFKTINYIKCCAGCSNNWLICSKNEIKFISAALMWSRNPQTASYRSQPWRPRAPG